MCTRCGRTWVTAGVEAAVERGASCTREGRGSCTTGGEERRGSGLREERLGACSTTENPIYRSRTLHLESAEYTQAVGNNLRALRHGGSHPR